MGAGNYPHCSVLGEKSWRRILYIEFFEIGTILHHILEDIFLSIAFQVYCHDFSVILLQYRTNPLSMAETRLGQRLALMIRQRLVQCAQSIRLQQSLIPLVN